jgi:hypothetical protein
MFYSLLSPPAGLESMFGALFSGLLENIIIRRWSALVWLMGVMLIYSLTD